MKVYKRERDGAWQMNYSMDGKQRQIYLGKKHTAASAGAVGEVVKELLLCRYRCMSISSKLMKRFQALDRKLQETIRRHGILSERYVDVTFGDLVEMFLESKKGYKQTTVDCYKGTFKCVREFFDCDAFARDISEEDVYEYKAYLLNEKKLAPCTVSRRVYDIRSLFKLAIRKKLVFENPAIEVTPGPMANDNRFRFIERPLIMRSLESCECSELRFAVILARFAGLRMPSEIRNMRFRDFGKDSFFVHEDTKTGRREVPLFPEIRKEIERLRQGREAGDYVFSREIVKGNSLYKRYEKKLKKAGVEKWPRLFNNLRASCVTEYDEMGFNEKTLDSIFGNSSKIRKRHYVGFRKDRVFMMLLGNEKEIVEEMVALGGVIDTSSELSYR